jgi:hypothetical protein
MGKLVDLKPAPERTNLAAAVAVKFGEAQTRLAHFEAQVGEAALAASLEQPGAGKGLAELNAGQRMGGQGVSIGLVSTSHWPLYETRWPRPRICGPFFGPGPLFLL